MRWACCLQPVASMHKFRLPWGDGESEYLGGTVYLPVWGPQTTTETRLVVTDHSAANVVRYDNRVYEQQMFYFNTVTRVQLYEHPFDRIPGLCKCYDCAAECVVLLRYLAKLGFRGSVIDTRRYNDTLADAMRALSVSLSTHCSSSGGRTLATQVDARERKSWFDARTYNVDARRIEPAQGKSLAERMAPSSHVYEQRAIKFDTALQGKDASGGGDKGESESDGVQSQGKGGDNKGDDGKSDSDVIEMQQKRQRV